MGIVRVTERDFADKLHKALFEALPGYKVTTDESLLYKVIVNETGSYHPSKPDKPTRGSHAFQTDLLVKKNNLPLVVVELKVNSFTTHDILTYSAKALKHKDIYPYLRYGLVVGGSSKIENRFFTHNAGFDFAMAVEDVEELDLCLELIRMQIESAEKLLSVLQSKNKTRMFSTKVEINT